jgi:hypothetical protein
VENLSFNNNFIFQELYISIINISNKPCRCRNTDYLEEDTFTSRSIDTVILIKTYRSVSGITFIRYAQYRNIGKPNKLLYEPGKWQIRVHVKTKLPNSEQSSEGKVKTHKYINRHNQSTTGKLWKPQWPWLGTGISKEMLGWIRF